MKLTPSDRSRRLFAILPFLALIPLLLSAAGCGYSTGNLLRRDIQSVSVQVFENETWRRGLEVDLTRQLTEEIRLRTPLRIKDEERSDSILTGTLVEFDEDATTQTEDDEILMRTITVTVEFRWVDSLTGRDLVEPVEFTERNTFALARAEPLSQRIFRETAETIVEKMERQW